MLVSDELPEFRCTGNAPTSCPTGLTCDPLSNVCVTVSSIRDGGDSGRDAERPETGPAPGLGSSCRIDPDCPSGLLCGTTNLLTTTIHQNAPFCTKPCCTSADCGSTAFVCYGAGTGGNYCVPADRAERTPSKTSPKSPGETCTESTECRSGLCDEGRCADTCCGDDECATGTLCRRTSLKGPGEVTHAIWGCKPPNDGGAAPNDFCEFNRNDQCRHGACVGNPDGVCTVTCCSTKDCTDQGMTDALCTYITSGAADRIRACTAGTGGATPVGEACSSNVQCATRLCDPAMKTCVTPCCTSADCPSDEACLPAPQGGDPILRCQKSR